MSQLSTALSSRLLKATLQSIVTGLGGQFLLLVSGPIVARLLGVDGRGYLAVLNVWPMMLVTVGTFSVPIACAYFLSQNRAAAERILAETYRIAVMQVFVLMPVLWAILFLWSRSKTIELETAIYVTLLAVPVGVAYQYALAILQGQLRFRALNLMRLLPVLFYTCGVIVLFVIGENRLLAIVGTWVAAYFLSAVAATRIALKGTTIYWLGDSKIRNQLVRFGLHGHVGAVAPADNLRIDQLAISIFLTPASLGLYVVACAFTNLPRFISQSAGIVAYPAIAERDRNSDAERLLWRYFWGVTAFNGVVSTILIVTMPLLIPLFFGQEFASSIPIAQVLLIGATFAASRAILVEGLRGLGLPKASTLAEIAIYPWLLTGGAFLMWEYGVEGLAIGMTIGHALSLAVAIGVIISKKSRNSDTSLATTSNIADRAARPIDPYKE